MVPHVCLGCGKACPNGCRKKTRKRKNSAGLTQTFSDRKGDRGRISDKQKTSDRVVKEPVVTVPCTSPTQTDEKRGVDAVSTSIEEREQLEQHLQLLSNPTRRSRKYPEVLQFLYLMYKLRQLHVSGQLTEFAHRRPAASSDLRMYSVFAAVLLGMDKDLARDSSQLYLEDGSVLVNETPRGRASPSYVLDDARKLQPKHLARIETFISECHSAKGSGRVTVENICKDLLSAFGARVPLRETRI